MEQRSYFLGPDYSCREGLEGTSVAPPSYTSFSIEIPNNYHINHLNSFHPHHRPSAPEHPYPSAWDYNTRVYPPDLCCDPSGCCMSHYPSVCYPEVVIPHSAPYLPQNFTTTSPTWTHGGNVQCLPPSQVQHTLNSMSPERTVEQHADNERSVLEKSKKPCRCTKSQCLKLYCDCFANGEICNNCDCVNCCNNMEHKSDRNKAIETCLNRNPDAFHSKMRSIDRGEVKGSHTRGCNCKNSGCLKNYCECYKAKIMCSSLCKCVSCSNYSRSKVKESAVQKTSHPDDNDTHPTTNFSCITHTVVEATCRCLLAQAEEAEKEGFSGAQAERATLKEFRHCLTQIIHFMFRHTHK